MNLNNIKTKIYIFVSSLFFFNFCFSFSNDLNSVEKFGYGRVHTEYIKFYNTDRTADFQSLAKNEILPLRESLMKYRTNESDNALNIACIAFDFFDEQAECLNRNLVYFKDPILDMDKYYFISGRLPWGDIDKEENGPIVGVSETKKKIKKEQIICLSKEISDCKNTIKKLNEIQKKIKSDFPHTVHLLEAAQQGFLSEFLFNSSLNLKALEYEGSFIQNCTRKNFPENIISTKHQKIVYTKKPNIIEKYKNYILSEFKLDEKENKEFMFVHSEQLALVLLKQKLKDFLKDHFEKCTQYEKKDVKICVIYIYSYNTICARCSTSYLYDFHADDGLKSEIFKVLGEKIEIYNVAVTQVVCETSFLPNTQLPKPNYYFYDKELDQNQEKLSPEKSFSDYIYQYILPRETPSSQPEDEPNPI